MKELWSHDSKSHGMGNQAILEGNMLRTAQHSVADQFQAILTTDLISFGSWRTTFDELLLLTCITYSFCY